MRILLIRLLTFACRTVSATLAVKSSPATVCQPSAENAMFARKADPFIHASDSEIDSPYTQLGGEDLITGSLTSACRTSSAEY